MERGYVKIWRKLEDSGLLQMPNTLALFMFLLMKASRTKRKVGTSLGVIELLPGQYISGRKQLAELLEQGEQQIRTSLARLESMEIITSTPTSKYSLYTIVNYELYQDNNQQVTSKLTNSQPASQPADNQHPTTKQECINISTSLRSVDKPAPKRAKKTQLPEDFTPCETAIQTLKAAGLSVQGELAKFRDHAKANARTQADWQAAFRTWASKAVEWNKPVPQKTKPQYQTAADKQREQANRMFGDLTNGRGREIDVSEAGAEWDRPALSYASDDLR
jgi:hypothetical protein